MYRNKPVVRPGGVMILLHPVPWEFHQVHHPSYVDFFEEVLAETTDPATIESKFEEQYATDPWYIHLYRTSYAYHGVHPFYMWYWGAHALDYLGDVIVVGGNRKACERMGYRAATTFRDALEMAGETVGRSPSIAYFHMPPFMVRGRALMAGKRSSPTSSGTSPRAGAGAGGRSCRARPRASRRPPSAGRSRRTGPALRPAARRGTRSSSAP